MPRMRNICGAVLAIGVSMAMIVVAAREGALAQAEPEIVGAETTEADVAPTDIANAPTEPAASSAGIPALQLASAIAPMDVGPGNAVLGPETNLPLPRFVSLKSDEGNVRRGPSLSHRIDWVFTRRDMPLVVTAEYGHWRRVADREGLGGWVHYALLSGNRTVIVDEDMLPLYSRPTDGAPQTALLELGVVARLGECSADWCRITAGGFRGWTPKTALWGVSPEETRD